MLKLNSNKITIAFTIDKNQIMSGSYLYKSNESVFGNKPVYFSIPEELVDAPPKRIEVTVELK